jgi:hypothetical protein
VHSSPYFRGQGEINDQNDHSLMVILTSFFGILGVRVKRRSAIGGDFAELGSRGKTKYINKYNELYE